MLRFDSFWSDEVNLNVNIVQLITGSILRNTFFRKYLLVLWQIEFIDHHCAYLFHIILKVDHQLTELQLLFSVTSQLGNPRFLIIAQLIQKKLFLFYIHTAHAPTVKRFIVRFLIETVVCQKIINSFL